MRRTKGAVQAVLVVMVAVAGLARQASGQTGTRVEDLWQIPSTPLEAVIKAPRDPAATPTHVTLRLTRGELNQYGRADLTLGPAITMGTSCPPVSYACWTERSLGTVPMAAVHTVFAFAINAEGERLVWGIDTTLGSERGSLMHLNPETGEACPVCTVPGVWGGYLHAITVSRGPRVVMTWEGALLVQPAGSLWGLDRDFSRSTLTGGHGGFYYVEPESGSPANLSDTWFEDRDMRVYTVAAGENDVLYVVYNSRGAGPLVNPQLAVLDSANWPMVEPAGELRREDGAPLGTPTAMLYRPSAVTGSAPELLIAVKRSFVSSAGTAVGMRPAIYRFTLAESPEGVLAPVDYQAPRSAIYDLYVPAMADLDLGEVPILESLAQREGRPGSLLGFIEELRNLANLFDQINCDQLPIPDSCVRRELILALQDLRQALNIGNFVSAQNKAVEIGERTDGCKMRGRPDADDWTASCPAQGNAFGKAQEAYLKAGEQLAGSP